MTPQYRIEQYLAAINAAYLGEAPLPEYPAEPVWHIEGFLAAILSAVKGDSPVMACPDPVWHIEGFARAIYDALVGASPAWPCPTATNNIETILLAIYNAVADGTETDGITTSWDIEKWLMDSYDAAKEGGASKETVTGNAPITLANAVARAIVSLTQTGLCAQAATPTPSAPVDIKCNNGALKMVDDELPAGYKRVLGFDCNNNAMWEITDFHLKGSDTVRISFSVEAACNVFGCYQGTEATDNYDLYASTTSGSKYLRYGNGTYLSYWSSANLGQRFDVVFTPTGTTGMPQDSTWTAKTFMSANDLLIGSTTTTGTSSKLKGNLYGSIVVDGRLNLVPCERVSDSVLGYYDTYTNTFYEPYTGFDGAVSLGYDGSHYVLQTVGTAEVLTVTDADSNTQYATAENLYSVGNTKDTQDIISGHVDSKIDYVILDGTEDGYGTSSAYGAAIYISSASVKWKANRNGGVLCTHFTQGAASGTQPENTCFFNASGHFYFRTDKTTGQFKTWLAEQYAAGTPVIIMFVRSTPATDSVTPQPLTTAKGTNTVSVTAEVSPVALTCEYHGASS